MSQNRQKKQLSTMDNVSSLSDQDLRAALVKFGVAPGPITDSTRNIYQKKLATLIDGDGTQSAPSSQGSKKSSPQTKSNSNVSIASIYEREFDEDESDEDFEVFDEELDEESEEDEDEDEEEVDDDSVDEKHTSVTKPTRSNTSRYQGDDMDREDTRQRIAAYRRTRMFKISIVFLLVNLVAVYLVSLYRPSLLEPLRPYKGIAKKLVTFLILTPFFYIVHRTYDYFKQRRNEENKRVHELVSQALELLQSPDNPNGMMPVLHIRDTLLTPAERKSKNQIKSWNRATKFVEEHESRVKVELINVDGEDFRAWKWIGSRKV